MPSFLSAASNGSSSTTQVGTKCGGVTRLLPLLLLMLLLVSVEAVLQLLVALPLLFVAVLQLLSVLLTKPLVSQTTRLQGDALME